MLPACSAFVILLWYETHSREQHQVRRRIPAKVRGVEQDSKKKSGGLPADVIMKFPLSVGIYHEDHGISE